MNPIFNELHRETLTPKAFLDILCFRNQRHNMLGLRAFMGDESYIRLLDRYAGTYMRFPTATNAAQVLADLQLLIYYEDMRKKRKTADVKAWNDAETRFVRALNKRGVQYKSGIAIARQIKKEVAACKEWLERMAALDERRKREIE